MFNKPFAATKQGTITAEQISKDMLIVTHCGAIAANIMEQSLGSVCAAKGTGRKRRIRSWSTTSSTARPSLGRSMSEFGAEHDKLEKCETMHRFRGGFPLQKDRGRSLSKASTHAYVSRCSSGMRITQYGPLPRKGFRRHRPEEHLLVPRPFDTASVPNSTLVTTWSAPPLGSFKALAKRANWLGVPSEFNCFGRSMLATGCL